MSLPRFQTGNPFSAEPSPSGHKGLKKGVYLVPSLFTALNILAGFFSLMETMTGFSLLGTGDATRHFDYAAMAIGWALLFDILDGRVARMTRSTTEIGIQLDSLADIVSFGLAPAMLVYAWGYGTALDGGRHPESGQEELRRPANSGRRMLDRVHCSLCSDAHQICATRRPARRISDGAGGLPERVDGQHPALHQL